MHRFYSLVGLLLILNSTLRVEGANEPRSRLVWGEFGFYSKWERLPYEVQTDYPHIEALPSLDRFGELLKIAEEEKVNDATGREILLSQLATLSRCEFNIYPANPCESPHYENTILKYREWWDRYGKRLVEELPTKGKRFPMEWRSLVLSPSLECPSYPIILPESWVMRVEFRTGDYGGIVTERLDFKVSPEKCSLVRVFTTHTDAAPRVEEWKDLRYDEAQSYLAALIYLIDNPWLADEVTMISATKKQDAHILERPKEWILYCATVDWSGVLDTEGNVLIDSMPRHWDSVNHDAAPLTSYRGLGIPYDLILDRFPVKDFDPERARWVPKK